MNLQERDLLVQILKQLTKAKVDQKDNEAETLIRDAIAKQPDAAYLLVQRALLLEHALGISKAQNEELQAQLQNLQAGQKRSFLDNNPWAQVATAPNTASGITGNRQFPQQTVQQQPSNTLFGGGSSFLGNMATTAAGVVAGSFLYQGIENLMGNHYAPGFGGQSLFNEPTPETTVINNYYGDDIPGLADNDDYQQANSIDDSQFDDMDTDFDGDSGDSGWI